MSKFQDKINSVLTESMISSHSEFLYDEVKFIFQTLLLGLGLNFDVLSGAMDDPQSEEYAQEKMPQLTLGVTNAFKQKGILHKYMPDLMKEAGYSMLVEIANKCHLWKKYDQN